MIDPGTTGPGRPGSTTMRDRRSDTRPSKAALRALLNEEQLDTLRGLERFGWELKFVRKPLFQEAVPVVFDGDTGVCSILRPDGTLEDHPAIALRN